MQNRIVVVYGRKGYGKTTLLERLATPQRNVVVFDALGDYINLSPAKFRERLPGFTRHTYLERATRTITDIPLGALKPQPFNLVFTPTSGDLEQNLLEIYAALRTRWRKWHQRTCIVVDEADIFNRGNKSSVVIEEMVKRGRHILLDQLYATRRPAELPRLVSSQADDFYVMRIAEFLDLEHLRKFLPKEVVAGIPHLDIGEYVHLDTRKPQGENIGWLRR